MSTEKHPAPRCNAAGRAVSSSLANDGDPITRTRAAQKKPETGYVVALRRENHRRRRNERFLKGEVRQLNLRLGHASACLNQAKEVLAAAQERIRLLEEQLRATGGAS